MAYPVVSLRRPAALEGHANGELPDELLRPIDARGARLLAVAALAWLAMAAAALRDGIVLEVGSVAEAYRTFLEQRRIFLERYTTDIAQAARPLEAKVYEGRTYYRRSGVATAAVPGTSNHGLALAVDIAGASGARLRWLLAEAWRYGFSWEIQSEPWHLRYVAGDAIPEAVLGHAPAGGLVPQSIPTAPAPTELDLEELDLMATTVFLPDRRPLPPERDSDPIWDFPLLAANGEQRGGGKVVVESRILIRQRPASGEDRIVTVHCAGEPRAVSVPGNGEVAEVEVWARGFASVGGSTPAFATRTAAGMMVEARELWVPS